MGKFCRIVQGGEITDCPVGSADVCDLVFDVTTRRSFGRIPLIGVPT